ncbi:MAG: ATP-binding protein [Devosia sp.]
MVLDTAGDPLAALATQVDGFAKAQGLGTKARFTLDLVLEELITNVVNHGAGPEGADVQVTLSGQNGTVVGTVSDNAMAFDPLAMAPPDTTSSLEERAVGGLGVHLVRTLASEISYAREGDRNVLRFTLTDEETKVSR